MLASFNPLLLASALLLCAVATPALANGGGGASRSLDSGTSSTDPNIATPSAGQNSKGLQKGTDLTTCPKGSMWDRKRRSCVEFRGNVFPDEEMADYAYALAKADRYDEALQVLDLLKSPENPKALNYRGYATRKLGDTDRGIVFYQKAVALDPTYTQVREYLGEAYVIKGRLDLADEQLQAIERLQGRDNEEYEDLATAITSARKL